MKNVNDIAACFRTTLRQEGSLIGRGSIQNRIDQQVNDVIINAVLQVPENQWITIKRKTDSHRVDLEHIEYRTTVQCEETKVSHVQVYVPIFESSQMPKDVHKCEFCSGYTKNDNVGNCGACGAPRYYEN